MSFATNTLIVSYFFPLINYKIWFCEFYCLLKEVYKYFFHFYWGHCTMDIFQINIIIDSPPCWSSFCLLSIVSASKIKGKNFRNRKERNLKQKETKGIAIWQSSIGVWHIPNTCWQFCRSHLSYLGRHSCIFQLQLLILYLKFNNWSLLIIFHKYFNLCIDNSYKKSVK